MNYRKTHTAPPSCPSTPFFKARDVTHNRDVVDSCDTSSLTSCVGRNSELHRIKHVARNNVLDKKVCQIDLHNKKDELVPRDALRSKRNVVLSFRVGVPRRS